MADTKKIVAYCGDIGGEMMLGPVVTAAKEQGYEAVLIPSSNKGKVTVGDFLGATHAVFVPSAFAEEKYGGYREEQVLAVALISAGVKVWWVEDVPVARYRITPNAYATGGSAGIITCTQQFEGCKGFFRHHYLGVPYTWRKTYETIASGQNVRGELKKCVSDAGVVSVKSTDMLVNIVGIREHALVLDVLEGILRYAQGTRHPEDIVIGIRAHPREEDNADAFARRADLLAQNPGGYFFMKDTMREGVPVETATGQIFGNPELMKSADVTIFPGGQSTDSIALVMAGLAAGYYTDARNRERNARQGHPDWPPATAGALHLIDGIGDIPRAMEYLFSAKGRSELHAKQARAYPAPGPDDWMTPEAVLRVVMGEK